MGSLEIEVDVNEAFIQRVQPGRRWWATLQAYPSGRSRRTSSPPVPAADRQKATVKVRIALRRARRPTRSSPTWGVKVAFQGETARRRRRVRGSSCRPGAASGSATRPIVFAVRDGRAERRAVTTGGTTGEDVEVLSGLRTGERVVLDPPSDLADGDPIRVREGNR
jgi:hypothetical protein